jgi:hypothetical protein
MSETLTSTRSLRSPFRSIARVLLFASLLVPIAEIVYPGCAIQENGTNAVVRIRSSPPRAHVYLDNRLAGEAPVTVHVSRWGTHRLRVELDGFEPAEIQLDRQIDVDSAEGDLLIGGFPIVIDLLTGAIFKMDAPKTYVEPGAWKFGPGTEAAELAVLATLHPTGDLKKLGQMQRKKRMSR